ncbi:3-oxoacyl-(acyl-carrier-protein) synthase protein (plasmid) [Rhizobium etli bv. mimosae str. IE4771]|uniref:3-oxoacyl-(Acyl-carrier-protein) synthase protein n=1 Tax=Rhizobium etli bv. mimosae str. IE4771 TaxID=1432050 RepID=A0A060IHX2_RHIET|nr:3-oxoacyl-ACP synthase [Rhizobium sp. IE4771]AIC31186.1 3-oxoacyl-(acyl-carrier-protein) synthase protein [Rhizobium sp. IE4771]
MSAMLDIVSIGMVTAVGLDAPSSCAAMRARLDGFQETQFVGPGGDWLIGAPVQMPRNWIGEKRLAHMAAAAICEAFDEVPEARGKTALVLCLPEEDRQGRPLQEDASVLRQISQIAEIELNLHSHIVPHGRPSGHVALDQARRLLARDVTPFVMIAGVDSYLTSAALSHYMGAERILTPNNSDGFIPGEAAAAVLCSRSFGSKFQLFGLGLAREPAFIYNGADFPLRGDGLTEAYRMALDEAGIAMNEIGYRIADLIGETYWFKQTALANLRLLRGRHDPQDLWSPAESLGNIGAAVVPLMLGMGWMGARKGYAPAAPVLIEASNDAGACGAAILVPRES